MNNSPITTNDTPAGQSPALGLSSGSASQARHRQMEVAMAFDLMSRLSELQQAERIARHYLSHAASAQHLLKITELVRYGGELTDDTKAAIKYLADQIRNNHAHDLGIELSWPNTELTGAKRPV